MMDDDAAIKINGNIIPEFNHLKNLIFLLITLGIFLNRLFATYQVNKWCK